MDSPNDTRARLRHELQQAYGEWLRASERGGAAASFDAGTEWRAYLAARQRLATACAEAAAADRTPCTVSRRSPP